MLMALAPRENQGRIGDALRPRPYPTRTDARRPTCGEPRMPHIDATALRRRADLASQNISAPLTAL